MSEEQVKRIAGDLVAHLKLDRCKLESIERVPRSQVPGPTTAGDEWVVRFAFEQGEDVACSTEIALVIVDDLTQQARLLDSL